MKSKTIRRFKQCKLYVIFVLYIVFIIYVTVLSRDRALVASSNYDIFWSYIEAFRGDFSLIKEIVLNILLFIPLGFFGGVLYRSKKQRIFLVILGITISVEILQLVLHCGLFEFDDIISNAVGGVLGATMLVKLLNNEIKQHIFVVFTTLMMITVCFFYVPESLVPTRQFEFQADVKDGVLSGYCFIYGKDGGNKYDILLKNDNDSLKLITETGILRKDVNDYFNCEYDYSKCGFKAFVPNDLDGTYSVLVKFSKHKPIETGCYYVNGELTYSSNDEFDKMYKKISYIDDGYLLLENEECCVYQCNGYLYWVVNDRFEFNDNGETEIQYQIHTTQVEKLSIERQCNQWNWDNRSFIFEDNEIDAFGKYRVARQKLPTEYSVIDITTGIYNNGEWVWKKTFRPILKELL